MSNKLVKLLDGVEYNYVDLIQKMEDDSYYYGELSQIVMSSTTIGQLLESPKKWKYLQNYKQDESPAMRIGRLMHTQLLEPEKYEKFHFTSAKSRAAKEFKELEAEGVQVFTSEEQRKGERLVDAVWKNEQVRRLIENARYEVPEVGFVQGIPFRGKADILRDGVIIDLKTSQSVKNFDKSADDYNYDVQAYIYCELFGIDYTAFKFLVIDKGTLDIGLFDIEESFVERGKAKVQSALSIYNEWKNKDVNDYILKGVLC
jgi:hypothetical protein